MKRYGVIGRYLAHSFSREIHARLADYPYDLIELTEQEVAPFFEKKEFSAVNVTIPYKQTVIPFLDSISEAARRIGAVNTVVNKGGRLYGYNTDYYGMKALVERIGLDLNGKKVLILGTGGTSRTAAAVARDMGAACVQTVSRRKTEGAITYEEAVGAHTDASVVINTTPVGMYPDCLSKPIDIAAFPRLIGVVDAVYNPLRTELVQDARKKGLKAEGGLYMLVMQAVAAVEHFLDTTIEKAAADRVFSEVCEEKENIVLTGMPGSGKSTVGRLLGGAGRTFIDTDAEIEKRYGCPISEMIRQKGVEFFREAEAEVIREISSGNGRVIATGGGAVLREENIRCLGRNGRLYFLEADISRLEATDDRPLSDTREKLERLYVERREIYRKTADVIVPDLSSAQAEADYIREQRRLTL